MSFCTACLPVETPTHSGHCYILYRYLTAWYMQVPKVPCLHDYKSTVEAQFQGVHWITMQPSTTDSRLRTWSHGMGSLKGAIMLARNSQGCLRHSFNYDKEQCVKVPPLFSFDTGCIMADKGTMVQSIHAVCARQRVGIHVRTYMGSQIGSDAGTGSSN